MVVIVSCWRDWSCLSGWGSGVLKERRRGQTGTCCSFGFEPFFNGGDLTGVSVSAGSSATALAGRWFFLRLLFFGKASCSGAALSLAFAFAAVGLRVLLARFISSISSGVALGCITCDKLLETVMAYTTGAHPTIMSKRRIPEWNLYYVMFENWLQKPKKQVECHLHQ